MAGLLGSGSGGSGINPGTMGLLGMAQSLMNAGQPTRLPSSTGSALAQGGSAYQNAMQMAMLKALMQQGSLNPSAQRQQNPAFLPAVVSGLTGSGGNAPSADNPNTTQGTGNQSADWLVNWIQQNILN